MSITNSLRGLSGFVPSWTQQCNGNPSINEILDQIDDGAIENANDTVKDFHLDWGLGADQINTDDIPEGATNKFFSDAAVEAYLGFGAAGDFLITNPTTDGYVWSSSIMGSQVSLDTTNFTNNLSALDTDVQIAMETLDNISLGIGNPVGTIIEISTKAIPTGYLPADGAAVSRGTYATLFAAIVPNKGTFTVTIASPGVFTLASHGLNAGDAVYFTTTGALPTGIVANTIYYVIAAGLTANDFRVALTRGGSAINTSGGQSGVHTLFECPWGLGNGSTTFNTPNKKNRASVGYDSTDSDFPSIGITVGAKTHTLQTTEIPSHNHTQNAHTHTTIPSASTQHADDSGFGTFLQPPLQGGSNVGSTTATNNAAGGGGSHNNIQPTVVTNFAVKF